MDKNNKSSNVHSGHRKRVKKAVEDNGFGYLSDHRLLELLLFYSVPRSDTNGIAHELLSETGSLQEVFCTEIPRLLKVDGVGENTAVLIATVGEIIKRASSQRVDRRVSLKSVDDFKKLAKSQLLGLSNERVVLVCLDAAKRVKRIVLISEGDKTEAVLDIRKAVQAVIDCEATSAFVAHNHPESTCQPSAGDIDSTRSLCVMFRKLGVHLIDHIIVDSDGGAYSMRSDPMFTQMFY